MFVVEATSIITKKSVCIMASCKNNFYLNRNFFSVVDSMKDYKITKQSPFTPGTMVDPRDFVGREDIIENIVKYIPTVISGKNRNFYIVGNRGMGKSSLSYYLASFLEENYSIIPIYISNEEINDLNSLIFHLVQDLLDKIGNKNWAKTIIQSFGDNIEQVGFLSASLKFTPKENYLDGLVNSFNVFIKDVANNIGDNNGILIIIDDINGLSDTPEFVNWFRGMMHKLTFDYDGEIPVSFLLTSYPENLVKLQNHNESFNRLFYHYNLQLLSEESVSLFFTEKLNKAGITCSDDILELMVQCSYGIPLVMQEIGDNIYWLCDQSKHINLSIALNGIENAANIIRDRYLNSLISDENYFKVLQIISKNVDSDNLTKFNTDDVKKELKQDELIILNAFIQEASEKEIITQISHFDNNVYKFNNPLYMVYIKLNSLFKD